MLKIYLSGASKNLDDHGNLWREDAKFIGDMHSILAYNPNDFYNYTDKNPNTVKECMKLFLHQVELSDVILVNLDYTDGSVGTGMEVMHATNLNKPIIGFGNTNVYPWVAEMCDVILSDLGQAMDYIAINYID